MDTTITLCMIVKDEERHLKRCLDSVKDKVTEIVIVDTGSKDKTLAIAEEYTTKIHYFKWVDDFAAARNESLKYATSDYILVLDADEYLESDADLQKDIKSDCDYVLLKIYNDVSYGRAFTHTAVRLFANHRGLHYHNRLHEHLNVLGENTNYKSQHGKVIIHHTGYTDEIMQEKDKTNRNLPLMLQEVEENPDAYNLYNMGKTYLSINEHAKAIEYFQRAYPLSAGRMFLPELITKMCYCLGELKQYEDSLRILNDAVKVYPNETDMHYMQGRIFMDAGYIKDAEMVLKGCLDLGGDLGITVTEGTGGYMTRFVLAELYESRNQLDESYKYIVEVLQEKKTFAPGLSKYFEIVTKSNIPIDDVYRNIEQLYNISNINDLQLLLDVLYGLRHPLLNKFLTVYSITAQPNVAAAAMQYDKKYAEAKDIWMNMECVTEENGKDLLLLSFLLNDDELFNLAKPLLNLSGKEEKIIRKIIKKEIISSNKMTSYVEKILGDIVSHLLKLQEYECLQIILEYLAYTSLKSKVYSYSLLISYGFTEVAIDLLVKLFEEHPNNVEVIRLLGDVCLSCNYTQDAQLLYSKLLELIPDYGSYERCYKLYEKIDDRAGMSRIVESIKNKFPRSLLAI